ncbi:hypothetical protein [Bacillus sp. ISL-7]|uniref:hypothetical protein n=1 Tax=Bacillus sp. ISL-7 TaxID=2819136 RepID=UPI001BE5F0EE|nr:hypothetical protein [Bacillus sp. ISL-7]MBT2734733.1 hypothetical protein [Bacillus sp. ISL-7]
MSEQIYSKKQALGYIANALFHGDIPYSDLKVIMGRANNNIKRDQMMHWTSVNDLFLSICGNNRYINARNMKKQLNICLGTLHWSFDHHNEEWAEKMFDAYVLFSGDDSLLNGI